MKQDGLQQAWALGRCLRPRNAQKKLRLFDKTRNQYRPPTGAVVSRPSATSYRHDGPAFDDQRGASSRAQSPLDEDGGRTRPKAENSCNPALAPDGQVQSDESGGGSGATGVEGSRPEVCVITPAHTQSAFKREWSDTSGTISFRFNRFWAIVKKHRSVCAPFREASAVSSLEVLKIGRGGGVAHPSTLLTLQRAHW